MRYKIPIRIIELDTDNFHPLVSGVFADGANVTWVIDTGASKTVFDKSLSEKYMLLENENEEVHSAGIGEKPLETQTGKLNIFYLGKMKIEMEKVALLDLSHINILYSKATPLKVCGLIGGDFLMKHKAIIDYKRKLLVLRE